MIEQILAPFHLNMLREGSALSDAVIAARGYRTINSSNELAGLGFAPSQQRAPGLLIPLWTTDGSIGLHIFRPERPPAPRRLAATGEGVAADARLFLDAHDRPF